MYRDINGLALIGHPCQIRQKNQVSGRRDRQKLGNALNYGH